MHKLAMSIIGVILLATLAAGSGASGPAAVRTLDGSGNNPRHADWGEAGTQYVRVAPANYADGIGKMVSGPSPRYISNRVFNDEGQNLFSENDISQWGWAWGQFIDHDMGLRDETPAENAPMAFDAKDPPRGLPERLRIAGVLTDARRARHGREDATPADQHDRQLHRRLERLRREQLPAGLAAGRHRRRQQPGEQQGLTVAAERLPAACRCPLATPAAPPVDLMGALVATPEKAVVAGDVRANENVALTSIHTLFAREHNRIVAVPCANGALGRGQVPARATRSSERRSNTSPTPSSCPRWASGSTATAATTRTSNPGLGNEFATVGYRAHSMIHGEFEPTVPAGTYTGDQLNRVFPRRGSRSRGTPTGRSRS